MIPDGLDPVLTSKIISQLKEHVTCIECCKYYIAPATAACGHTLCHGCWIGRRSCPVCALPLVRKNLRQNIPMQTLTDHTHALDDEFENVFNIKLDEFTLDVPENVIEKDSTKHVKDWLASSQNHFSGPVLCSQQSTEDTPGLVELSASKIQIHADNKLELTKMNNQKTSSPTNVTRAPVRQDDWDKIETLPDTGENVQKNKETLHTETVDVEPFFIDSNEYSTENPRRSNRKKDIKNDSTPQTLITSVDKHSSKNSSTETDKKSTKSRQNWSNVKKMSKEFGKLNSIKRNKLNISIEMCKKTKSSSNKPETPDIVSLNPYYKIDDNTPDIVKDQAITKETPEKASIALDDQKGTLIKVKHNKSEPSDKSFASGNIEKHQQIKENNEQPKESNKNILDKINSTFEKIENDKLIKNQSTTDSDLAKNNDSNAVSFIKKGILHLKTTEQNCVRVVQNEIDSDTVNVNTDDIEISIKVGNTITNIFIKKKENDVQLKVNTDREIQTSLGPYSPLHKHDASCSPIKENNTQNLDGRLGLCKTSNTTPVIPAAKITPVNRTTQSSKMTPVSKSTRIKKNTDSADTATANFEITESVEKELSDLMECVETDEARRKDTKLAIAKSNKSVTPVSVKHTNEIVKAIDSVDDIENLNDLDIFGSGSVNEANVHLLKNSEHAPSEIFVPTLKSKKSQQVANKRERDENNAPEMPHSKKQKPNFNTIPELPTEESLQENDNAVANNSEAYNAIMSQVFANIDADIKNQNTKRTHDNIPSPTKPTQKNYEEKNMKVTQTISKNTQKPDASVDNPDLKEVINQKDSENIFSLLEKDSESTDVFKNNQQHVPQSTQDHIKNLLTPGMCRDLAASLHDEHSQINDVEMIDLELATPVADQDDSDKSVVEETPQKSTSYSKNKQKPDQFNKTVHNVDKQLPKVTSNTEKKVADLTDNSMSDSQFIKSIINISDSADNNKNETLLEMPKRSTLETPLTINKFVGLIKHNSTPVARKSLNFEDENLDDSEQTLCPTTTQTKQNTQEKEFLKKAFEASPKSPVRRPLGLKNVKSREYKKVCLAGSCLTPSELAHVKILCTQKGWSYVDKYTNDLTHLVVGVDEENKSQRSVKYMCALAASKWIVSYSWVEKCLKMKDVVDEEPYEALDAGGEPGPKRSRVATRKLFDGFTFYCMPPFSILDLDTLKNILESAGGRVVDDPKGVKLTENSPPALLLAEPENTEEDRFIYLALELNVVPVNYEWVLNCLGTYSICSIHELLLCPSAVLPPCIRQWPAALLESDN